MAKPTEPTLPKDLPTRPDGEGKRRTLLRVLLLVAFLYGFLLSIKLMSSGLKLIASEHEAAIEAFVSGVSRNPVIALFVGVVLTAIVQSSSFTTCLVVSLVIPQEINGQVQQVLSVEQAIPIVMGANIGTTITNTLVSLGHVSRREEFRRAFSGAVVHDIFNLLSVAILFPVEMAFHPLRNIVMWMVPDSMAKVGGTFPSVLDPILKPVIQGIEAFLLKVCHLGVTPAGILAACLATALLFVCLFFMVKQLKQLVMVRLERFFDRILFRNGTISFLLGMFMTFAVQSSSVTTSLVVPLLGAGLLSLEQIFPYTVGANIGTTITAMLAALASGSGESLRIALVHTMFNCLGAVLFLPLRFIPIGLARQLGRKCERHRWYAAVHLIVVFVIIPAIAIALGHFLTAASGPS